MKITTAVEIPPRRIADLMVTAIEGGIGYWCKSVKLKVPPEVHFKSPWYDNENIYNDPGLMIQVQECEFSSDENKSLFIDLKKIEQAFILMQEFGKPKGWHWQNFITENDDAETADVWFQLAVFGEVVYG